MLPSGRPIPRASDACPEVYLHKTGRVAESLDYTAGRSHPYLKLFHVPPEDNPYMWNTKVAAGIFFAAATGTAYR